MKINKIGIIKITQNENGEVMIDIEGCDIDCLGIKRTSGEVAEFLLLHVIEEVRKDSGYSSDIDSSMNNVTYK